MSPNISLIDDDKKHAKMQQPPLPKKQHQQALNLLSLLYRQMHPRN
jgi:hypothetical protein